MFYANMAFQQVSHNKRGECRAQQYKSKDKIIIRTARVLKTVEGRMYGIDNRCKKIYTFLACISVDMYFILFLNWAGD